MLARVEVFFLFKQIDLCKTNSTVGTNKILQIPFIKITFPIKKIQQLEKRYKCYNKVYATLISAEACKPAPPTTTTKGWLMNEIKCVKIIYGDVGGQEKN